MIRTSELIAIFHDTQNCIENDPLLHRAAEDSRRLTRVYEEGFVSQKKKVKSGEYRVSVMEGFSFQCAGKYANGIDRIAVLNFANPFEPGGGVARGARAQEESLCRCSTLFSALSSPEVFEQYYAVHNSDKHNNLFSDRIIYSPDVVVFKDDTTYERLPEAFRVDVLTCAAPYNVYGHDRDLLIRTYDKRLTNIFEAAADNDVDVLILGAFGCGVFHNPPDLMAEAFKKLIQNTYFANFKEICFPLVKSAFTKNYEVFSQILSDADQ